jgi:hypothetical protein
VGTLTDLLVLEAATAGDEPLAEGLADFQGLEDGRLAVPSPADRGQLVRVRVASASGVDLIGEVADDEP